MNTDQHENVVELTEKLLPDKDHKTDAKSGK